MNNFIFKLIVFLLTVINAIIPSNLNISYKHLPVKLEIESISDVYVPEDVNSTNVQEYPTVLMLCHQKNEADNGKLFVTFEKWGSRYPVYESTDDSASWHYVSTVEDTLNGYWNEWMPFLYELPADMGGFEKGTILLAATSVHGEGVTDSTVTLYSSTDLCRSFTPVCNIDKAGGIDWGVWEPYLIYEEETGRLFCFYSDDSDPGHSQKLVYKYTTDLINWSEKFECVACDDYNLRPGMVSVTKMGNGEYFMVYEMVGLHSNPIYYKKSTSLDDWGDAADYGKPVSATGKTFGSSPYTLWVPSGGKCGTLIVLGKHPINGGSKTGTDMFLSFDYGESFVPVDNPIPYSLDPYGRCSYSPSLFLAPDGETVYYANNVPYGEAGYKISVAKIRIT